MASLPSGTLTWPRAALCRGKNKDCVVYGGILWVWVVVIVRTHGHAFPQPQFHQNDNQTIKRNPPVRLPKSVSSFMAEFKSALNTKIDEYIEAHQFNKPKYNKTNHFFQPNYHDHNIRNEWEYQRIAKYIRNNPGRWEEDGFFDEGQDE